jgi:diaminohydroxyphosphoribosylaminopyrimidine deaminase/5-amino-6-(5-phosphoribosylamino)uracil reductase
MRAEGATIYVTLEPCCHYGKTPPCTDALIQAGIRRVVYGYRDPAPKVNGKGHSILQGQGAQCDYIATPEIDAFYESYAYWCQEHKPFITAKIAMTFDGKITGKNGERIQITGKELQVLTHTSRQASDAILTTSRTIIQDDPSLNVRHSGQVMAKPIYVLDSQCNFPLKAALFQTAQSITLFHAENADTDKQRTLTECGVRCVPIRSASGRLDLSEIVHCIGKDGVHDLWIEAGGQCFAAFIRQKLLRRAWIYVAPRWLGSGQSAFPENFTLDISPCEIHWQQFGKDALCEIRW